MISSGHHPSQGPPRPPPGSSRDLKASTAEEQYAAASLHLREHLQRTASGRELDGVLSTRDAHMSLDEMERLQHEEHFSGELARVNAEVAALRAHRPGPPGALKRP